MRMVFIGNIDSKAIQSDEHIKNEMANHNIVGLAINVSDKKGSPLYQGCFGYKNKKKGVSVTHDTVFVLASLTKSFTALSIIQLAEKKIINLHSPISDYMVQLENFPEIAFMHLLTHTSGFPTQTTERRDI